MIYSNFLINFSIIKSNYTEEGYCYDNLCCYEEEPCVLQPVYFAPWYEKTLISDLGVPYLSGNEERIYVVKALSGMAADDFSNDFDAWYAIGIAESPTCYKYCEYQMANINWLSVQFAGRVLVRVWLPADAMEDRNLLRIDFKHKENNEIIFTCPYVYTKFNTFEPFPY